MNYSKECPWSTIQCTSDNKLLFAQDARSKKLIIVNAETKRLEFLAEIRGIIADMTINYASIVLYMATWNGKIYVLDIQKQTGVHTYMFDSEGVNSNGAYPGY